MTKKTNFRNEINLADLVFIIWKERNKSIMKEYFNKS